MSHTFIKLHDAWSGKPFYVEASDVCTVGQNPEDLSETSITMYSGRMGLALETPDEVMHLMAAATDTFVVSDDEYDAKVAERRDAIIKRAAERIKANNYVYAALKDAILSTKENA